MGLGFDATAEEISIFLEEAEEQILTLEEGIMALEKTEGAIEDELLQSIFRAAHTLKGSSAALGHVKMARLTHEMENILDQLRKNEIEVSLELIELLLDSIDGLRIFRDEVREDEDKGYDCTDLVQRLKELAAGESLALDTSAEDADLSAPDSSFDPHEEEIALEQASSLGQDLFSIRVKLDTENTLPSVRAYQVMMLLEDLGIVSASKPSLRDLEKDLVDDTFKALW